VRSRKIREQFRVVESCIDTQARLGELVTQHGAISTPIFLPVGSQGTVKTLTPEDLKDVGVTIILSNTYHLYLRPGIDTIERLGGLHRYMAWERPILTDSGGYQVFSLASLCKVIDSGVIFRSHIDGSEHFFSPESVIAFQERLGSDIMMTLDECAALDESMSRVEEAMKRSCFWAKISKEHHNSDKLLFAIVQGGLYPDLRRQSATALSDLDFQGYAIGGLSLGEPKELTWSTVEMTIEFLPDDKPRYLMGVGSPEDIVEGISRGIDIFDSALPTRVARNGALYTMEGRQNISKAVYKMKEGPIDEQCDCYTCLNFSAAYLHHLFKCGELLAYRLATIHNLRFIVRLIQEIHESIRGKQFPNFKRNFLGHYQTTDELVRQQQKKKWLNSQRLY
jgi:queuine tRNA-ribosyltransferase